MLPTISGPFVYLKYSFVAHAPAFICKAALLLQQALVSSGRKPGRLPVLGLASQLGQGDTDPCPSGGFLYKICSVIKPLKIPTHGEMMREKRMVMRNGAAARV